MTTPYCITEEFVEASRPPSCVCTRELSFVTSAATIVAEELWFQSECTLSSRGVHIFPHFKKQ